LFKEITQEEILNVELSGYSMLYLCDSLILELRATGKEEILEEVKSILGQFRDFVVKRYSYHWFGKWEEIVMEKPMINEIIELTQLEDLIERMIHRKIYRKEEEVLDYALLAKEFVDKIDKK
jgi:hypothetical protein